MSAQQSKAKRNTPQRVTGHLKLVTRREGPVWYVKTRVPGREPCQTTHRLAPAHLSGGKPPAGHLTRRQAQDALAELLVEERRKLGQGAYDHQPGGATFADAAAGFLRHVEVVKGREVSTLRDYRQSIDRYLLPRWGERPVEAITPDDVKALRDQLLKAKREGREDGAPLSTRTVVRHLTVAHGVFRYAMREHGLTRNPASAELVDRPTVRYSGEFETFDAEELAALVRAAEDPATGTLYLTAAMTGLRQGELLALRWRDVDFAGQRLHVRRAWSQAARAEKAPKSGKVRSVPLVAELVGPLDQLSRREHFTGEDNLVFCTALGAHLDGWTLRRRYDAALKRAGLRGIRFHDLRHCFGSVAVRAFPLSDVQAMLGHAHVTTTMRYVHHRPGADDAARLSSAFAGEDVSPLVVAAQGPAEPAGRRPT
ncbi:MAG TPA: site-specific integrase [Solirubrobacteraceae bacterium]|nr:site-specific integrase [Solirubrobacteraceae bacterium]